MEMPALAIPSPRANRVEFDHPVTPEEWRHLADEKFKSAMSLKRLGRRVDSAGLLSVCLEAEIKAIIARRERFNTWPSRRERPDLHTHDLARLIRVAGLDEELSRVVREEKLFSGAWRLVKDLTPVLRYSVGVISASQLQEAFDAVQNSQHGVRQWLRSR